MQEENIATNYTIVFIAQKNVCYLNSLNFITISSAMQKKRVLINESIVSIEKMSRRFSRKGKELPVIIGLLLIVGSLLILHQDSFIQVISAG